MNRQRKVLEHDHATRGMTAPADVVTWAHDARRETPTERVEGHRSRPDPAQLAAVMQPIVETVDPEMVIVFGSAARATMTAESDVDLVVVKDVSNLEAMKARAAVCLPTGHPPVHIVPATKRLLSDLRDSRSWVYGPAMAEGIVAYERDGDTRGWSTRAWDRIAIPESPGERMVRILHYQREEAMDWLSKAGQDMQVVRSGDTTIGLQVRCYSAQAAAEKAIKALLVAHGQPVRAEHELHNLAEELEKTGEKLPATATRERLELLAKFGGEAQYPRWQDPTTDADKTPLLPDRHADLRPRTSADAGNPRCARERRHGGRLDLRTVCPARAGRTHQATETAGRIRACPAQGVNPTHCRPRGRRTLLPRASGDGTGNTDRTGFRRSRRSRSPQVVDITWVTKQVRSRRPSLPGSYVGSRVGSRFWLLMDHWTLLRYRVRSSVESPERGYHRKPTSRSATRLPDQWLRRRAASFSRMLRQSTVFHQHSQQPVTAERTRNSPSNRRDYSLTDKGETIGNPPKSA